MKTYVIFNKRTGDIVHTHTEVALSGEPLPVSREEMLALYQRPRPGAEVPLEDLDVLDVDQELIRRGLSNRQDLYVDVENRVLSERAAKRPEQP